MSFYTNDNDYYNLTNKINFFRAEHGIKTFEASIKFLVSRGKKGCPDYQGIETEDYNSYNMSKYKHIPYMHEIVKDMIEEIKRKEE